MEDGFGGRPRPRSGGAAFGLAAELRGLAAARRRISGEEEEGVSRTPLFKDCLHSFSDLFTFLFFHLFYCFRRKKNGERLGG